MRRAASLASGSLVKSIAFVSASPNSPPATSPIAPPSTTTQATTVRHGWRLLARANDSGLILIVLLPSCACRTYNVRLRCTAGYTYDVRCQVVSLHEEGEREWRSGHESRSRENA